MNRVYFVSSLRSCLKKGSNILSHITAVPSAFDIKRRKPGGLQVRGLQSANSLTAVRNEKHHKTKNPIQINEQGLLRQFASLGSKKKAATYSPT